MAIIAAIQMASTNDPQQNLDRACELIATAASAGAKLVVLPEEFLTLGMTAETRAALAENFQQGSIQQRLQTAARTNQVWIVAGTLPLKSQHPHKMNASCLVFDDKGQIIGRYDKIHLFDVEVGEDSYRESENVVAGTEVVVINTPLGPMGLSICYDIRFPELYRALMHQGALFFVVPSAFTIPTGKAHWEILLKARAIENLCYVIAPNEAGTRANGLKTYGHSMIVSPWGETLAEAQNSETILYAEIDLTSQQKIRQNFPALNHRKL